MTTLWWLRYPFLVLFLALIMWFAYALYRRAGQERSGSEGEKDRWL